MAGGSSRSIEVAIGCPSLCGVADLHPPPTPHPTGAPGAHATPAHASSGSGVVVEEELVGVRTQSDRVDLALPLVRDVGVDEIRREDSAAKKKLLVVLECV